MPAELKKALQMALDGFAPQIPTLLEQVARKDPARALELVARLGDYVLPKMSRRELSTSGLTLEQLICAAGTSSVTVEAREATPETTYTRSLDGPRGAGPVVLTPPSERIAPAEATPQPAPKPAPPAAPPLLDSIGEAQTEYEIDFFRSDP